ncbi:hypothetical protein [Sporohalobacter salinus]|uniref:hypothetical protein n=1 Tax=Sporohalobacter salinus TaxID=1494606 RepID=UPI00195FC67D|nr:hypothetical protein [Sporohalobacter salinus]MBM7623666.1 hypothetical protein [Sporohalobacter salinus]
MMKCPECYSKNSRVTPLRGAKNCLENHRHYVCSTCGRHVCISLKGKRRARCFMPFSSLEDAILYLKCAEIIIKGPCEIYEITDEKSGRKSYKIYPNKEELEEYLSKNFKKVCKSMEPIYTSDEYKPVEKEQIKYLDEDEVKKYLEEM